jgi:Aerotolerance regulator N-terminal
MGFLAPWFLAGLAALALPLYLHLLKRQTRTPRLLMTDRPLDAALREYLILPGVRK